MRVASNTEKNFHLEQPSSQWGKARINHQEQTFWRLYRKPLESKAFASIHILSRLKISSDFRSGQFFHYVPRKWQRGYVICRRCLRQRVPFRSVGHVGKDVDNGRRRGRTIASMAARPLYVKYHDAIP